MQVARNCIGTITQRLAEYPCKATVPFRLLCSGHTSSHDPGSAVRSKRRVVLGAYCSAWYRLRNKNAAVENRRENIIAS